MLLSSEAAQSEGVHPSHRRWTSLGNLGIFDWRKNHTPTWRYEMYTSMQHISIRYPNLLATTTSHIHSLTPSKSYREQENGSDLHPSKKMLVGFFWVCTPRSTKKWELCERYSNNKPILTKKTNDWKGILKLYFLFRNLLRWVMFQTWVIFSGSFKMFVWGTLHTEHPLSYRDLWRNSLTKSC